jgi:hypothetical protein
MNPTLAHIHLDKASSGHDLNALLDHLPFHAKLARPDR